MYSPSLLLSVTLTTDKLAHVHGNINVNNSVLHYNNKEWKQPKFPSMWNAGLLCLVFVFVCLFFTFLMKRVVSYPLLWQVLEGIIISCGSQFLLTQSMVSQFFCTGARCQAKHHGEVCVWSQAAHCMVARKERGTGEAGVQGHGTNDLSTRPYLSKVSMPPTNATSWGPCLYIWAFEGHLWSKPSQTLYTWLC